MKICCFGDVHAHNFTDFAIKLFVKWDEQKLRYVKVEENSEDSTIKEMNSRLFNILNGLCDMRDYCSENNIKECLFSGDLFHHRATIDVSVFNTMYKVLSSFGSVDITIHAIAGNHDDVDNSLTPSTSLHSLNNVIHVIETPEKFVLSDGTEVVAIPYSKDKQFTLNSMESLRKQCIEPNSAILLCHLGISGGAVGSGMYIMNDEYTLQDLMYDKWKYVVAGHYHLGQLLEDNVFYCGTPVQCNFGDERHDGNYNGFVVIDTSKRYNIQFVGIEAPRFKTFSSAKELEKVDKEFLQNNYIRVKSSAQDASTVQEKLNEIVGDDKIEMRLELEKDYSVPQRSEVSVTQSFAESVKTYAHERWNDKYTLAKATDVGLDILSEAMNGVK